MSFSWFTQLKSAIAFFCKGKKSFLAAALVLFLNFIASLLEGASFGAVFLGFSYLNKEALFKIPFLESLSLYQSFTLLVVAALLLQLMKGTLTYFSQVIASRFAIRIQIQLQERIYTKIFNLKYNAVRNRKLGDLMELAISPSKFVRSIIDNTNTFVVSLMMVLGYLIFLSTLSLPLTISLILLFLGTLLLQKFVLKKIMSASEKQTVKEVALSTSSAQHIEGVKEIHLFNAHKFILTKIHQALQALSQASLKLDIWYHAVAPINEMISLLLVGLAVVLGLFFLKDTQLPLTSSLLTFMTMTFRLGTRVQVMMCAASDIIFYNGPLKRVQSFLAQNNEELLDLSGKRESIDWKQITFNQVSFTYPKKEQPTLQNLSLTINKGEILAIVGHSGAGKSTLMDLLMRLYEPTEGQILLDGRPARDFSLDSYRALFAGVSQDAFLFHSTIAENISFGDEEMTLTEVINASKKAHAHRFIAQLLEGYQTMIGERGHRLSGGERQRIALARALYRNNDILVLDEATSSLDTMSEQFIQQTIRELKGQKTIIMVAHRLSTVVQADRIIVLEGGRVVESGTHRELMNQRGAYENFWALQNV